MFSFFCFLVLLFYFIFLVFYLLTLLFAIKILVSKSYFVVSRCSCCCFMGFLCCVRGLQAVLCRRGLGLPPGSEGNFSPPLLAAPRHADPVQWAPSGPSAPACGAQQCKLGQCVWWGSLTCSPALLFSVPTPPLSSEIPGITCFSSEGTAMQPRLFFSFSFVPVGIRLFHRITRKAFQGPTRGRLWSGMVYSCGDRSCHLGYQCPISIHPTMENVQLCPQQGQDKSQYPEFLLHIKVQFLGAHRWLPSGLSPHPGG